MCNSQFVRRVRFIGGFGLLLVMLAVIAVPVPVAQAATVSVTDCSASSGAAGRLVNVITAAASGDTVNFTCSGAITVASTVTIGKNLTLDGNGQTITISGGGSVQVFSVTAGFTFNLQNLTVANGSATQGGGISNSGVLNLTNVTFSNNTATASFGSGGAILNNGGTLTVNRSTFSGNTAPQNFGSGGGIYNSAGTVNVINSTFSGNSVINGGGGIHNGGGILNITNSTFIGNSSTNGGGALSFGGNNQVTTITNTIVANSLVGGTCWSGYTINNGGNNIDSGSTCGWGSNNGSRSNTNPLVGPLANNGGTTQTHALLFGSPAIDGVTFNAPNGCPSTDQRGVARPTDGNGDSIARCDIGAFEAPAQAVAPAEVPEGDTLLLLGGGIGGLGVWLRYQWSKRRVRR